MSRHVIPGSRTRRTERTQFKAGRAGPWYQQFEMAFTKLQNPGLGFVFMLSSANANSDL